MIQNPSAAQSAKRCSLLQRRHDWSSQKFADHWAGPHAAIALTMSGIENYTQNRVAETVWARKNGQGFSCDGIVELEFRDAQAMSEAGGTEAVRRLLPEDEERFLDGITLCRVPGGARQVWPGMTKVMLAACLADGTQDEDLTEFLRSTKCVEFSVDRVSEVFHRERLRFESDPPQVFANLWFESGRDAKAAFANDSPWAQAATKVIRRGTAWRIDPLPIVAGGINK